MLSILWYLLQNRSIQTHNKFFLKKRVYLLGIWAVLLNGGHGWTTWQVLDNRHRQFLRGCLPWRHHRTQWHVYMADFQLTAIDNIEFEFSLTQPKKLALAHWVKIVTYNYFSCTIVIRCETLNILHPLKHNSSGSTHL